jgi:hypothetical protein
MPSCGSYETNKHGLTEREQLFINEYLRGKEKLNGGKAYMAVAKKLGIEVSESAARVNAWRYLKKPHIKKYLKERANRIARRAEYSQSDWLKDIVEVIHVSMGRKSKPSTVVVDGVKVQTPEGILEWDGAVATRALEVLGKSTFMKLFKEQLEVDASDQIKELMNMVKPTLGPPAYRTIEHDPEIEPEQD